MIEYTSASSDKDLKQILALQQKNLRTIVSEKEKEQEGFLTVEHDLEILREMNNAFSHTIARDNDIVVGYALSMTVAFGNNIKVLKPLFEKIKASELKNTSYIVMGQICVDKAYRGQGIFRGLYQKMKEATKSQFIYIITDIDVLNVRSLSAHSSVGFETLQTFTSHGQTWQIVYLKTS